MTKLDHDLLDINSTINQIRFAWKAKGNDKNVIFNNNKFNKITKEYLKCYEMYYLNFIIEITINKIQLQTHDWTGNQSIFREITSMNWIGNYSKNKKTQRKFKKLADKAAKYNSCGDQTNSQFNKR